MLNIKLSELNSLERVTHQKLANLVPENPNLRIVDAATSCDVSASKISKLAKKLGFDNFKHYKLFLCGQAPIVKQPAESAELPRLKAFIENFDLTLVDDFVTLIQKFDKIVLFGLGPSFICCEYFAYKLRIGTKKNICVCQSESHAQQLADSETLFIFFSVTGTFISFEDVFQKIKAQGAMVQLILEEYQTSASKEADNIIFLTKSFQNKKLLPHEKTRTLFFIFIEEVITKLMTEVGS